MPKVIRIVYGQVVEADNYEELEKKVAELKEQYRVAIPANPFLAQPTSRPSAVRVDETKVEDSGPNTDEEVFTLDEPPAAFLPEELGLTDEGDELLEEVVPMDSPGEPDGSSEEAGEEATAEEPEGEPEEEVIEIPENLDELPREELVAIAEALGLDPKGNKKTLLKRIREAIAEEEQDEAT